MSDLIYQVAVMAPPVMIVVTLAWYVGKLRGVVDTGAAFSTRHARTWPLTLVLSQAALFALIAASIIVALGESMWSTGIAYGVAYLVAIGLVPRLWAHFAR